MNQYELLEQLPLCLGITGHRDLIPSSVAQLGIEIKKVMLAIRAEFSLYTPIILITGLAEGADQLAAKIALDLGLTLVVVLPMKLEIYLKDFPTSTSKKQFLELLARADNVITLGNVDNVEDYKIENQHYRDKQYEQFAKFLAKHCFYIIALWDGQINNYKGGTSAVVNAKLSGSIFNGEGDLDLIDSIHESPIFIIDTPRIKNSNVKVSGYKKVYPYKWKNEQDVRIFFDLIVKKLNMYNDDLKRINSKKEASEYISSELKELQEAEVENKLVVDLINNIANNDNLAKYYQGFRVSFLKMILVGLIFASLFFNLYLEVWRYPLILGLYLLSLLIVTAIYFILKKNDYEHKHQDYRIIAETLRVQLYWLLSGINKNVCEYLYSISEEENIWINYVLRARTLLLSSSNTRDECFCTNKSERLKITYEQWIKGQLIWFQDKAKQNLLKSIKYENMGKRLFLTGILLIIILFIVEAFQIKIAPFIYHFDKMFNSVLIISSIMLITISASFAVFKEKMIFREHHDNYVRMGNLFEKSKLHYEMASCIVEKQNVIIEIGKEVIKDTKNWLIYNRLRPIEITKG